MSLPGIPIDDDPTEGYGFVSDADGNLIDLEELAKTQLAGARAEDLLEEDDSGDDQPASPALIAFLGFDPDQE